MAAWWAGRGPARRGVVHEQLGGELGEHQRSPDLRAVEARGTSPERVSTPNVAAPTWSGSANTARRRPRRLPGRSRASGRPRCARGRTRAPDAGWCTRPGSDPHRPRTAPPRADALRGRRQRTRHVRRWWEPASQPRPQVPAPRPRSGTGVQERLRSRHRSVGPTVDQRLQPHSLCVVRWVGRAEISDVVAPEVHSGCGEKSGHLSPDPPAMRRKSKRALLSASPGSGATKNCRVLSLAAPMFPPRLLHAPVPCRVVPSGVS